jgi:hypothetical protein
MTICPAHTNPCVAPYVCDERRLCARMHHAPIALLGERYRPAVHFVGFRGEEYHSAVRVFGPPDVYHRVWDQRAQREVAPADTVVFASQVVVRRGQVTLRHHPSVPPSPFNHDDSNQDDDPAAEERSS